MADAFSSGLVASFITPIVVGSVASLITTVLTFRRYQKEQWWQRKVQSYEEILQCMAKMRNSVDEWLEKIEEWHKEDEAESKERNKIYRQSKRTISELASIGAFTISPESSNIIERFIKEYSKRVTEDPYEGLTRDLKVVDKYIAFLRPSAKRDLGLK